MPPTIEGLRNALRILEDRIRALDMRADMLVYARMSTVDNDRKMQQAFRQYDRVLHEINNRQRLSALERRYPRIPSDVLRIIQRYRG